MKRIFLAILFSVLLYSPSWAQQFFYENFDEYPSDWTLYCDGTGDGRPYCPRDVFGIGPWPYCDADFATAFCGAPNPAIQITTAAARGGSGRGFRMYIYPDSGGTCCENGLTTTENAWPAVYNFYFRAYMRFNFNTQTNYKKLWRIKTTGSSQRFILDLYKRSEHGNKTYFIMGSLADNFSANSHNLTWAMEDNYTPGAGGTMGPWICVEILIEQTPVAQWTLWINDVKQGDPVALPASNYAIYGTMIGGNQCGSGGDTPHIVDYDDVVFSTQKIGLSGGEEPPPDDVTRPTVTAFTIPSTSTTLTIPISTFTATDDSGTVTGYLVNESSPQPSINDPGWRSSPQTSYSFSTAGYHTLYAWARDAAGNISYSLNDEVTITLPETTPQLFKVWGGTLIGGTTH